MPKDSNRAPPDRAQHAIAVTGLSYRYPARESFALRDIDFTVATGSCFGLLGPNGAGKTTLISLLTGLLKPQQGNVSIAGLAFPDDAAEIKACSALVPQDFAFYPTLTGRENLQFFAGAYRVPAAERSTRIDECAEICALTDVLAQRADRYSGGIKRRLNLAIGLLCRPRILYLDEPTVGIDAQSRHFILGGIEKLKRNGATIVYTSHYMEEIERICDDVAIIDGGRVLLRQSVDDVLTADRCLSLTPVGPLSPSMLAELQAEIPCRWENDQLVVDTGSQPLSRMIAVLEERGIDIRELNLGRNRLESVYLSMTSRELRD